MSGRKWEKEEEDKGEREEIGEREGARGRGESTVYK